MVRPHHPRDISRIFHSNAVERRKCRLRIIRFGRQVQHVRRRRLKVRRRLIRYTGREAVVERHRPLASADDLRDNTASRIRSGDRTIGGRIIDDHLTRGPARVRIEFTDKSTGVLARDRTVIRRILNLDTTANRGHVRSDIADKSADIGVVRSLDVTGVAAVPNRADGSMRETSDETTERVSALCDIKRRRVHTTIHEQTNRPVLGLGSHDLADQSADDVGSSRHNNRTFVDTVKQTHFRNRCGRPLDGTHQTADAEVPGVITRRLDRRTVGTGDE